jgi:hypothetical protein
MCKITRREVITLFIYRDNIRIPLTGKNGILMVTSVLWELNEEQMDNLTALVGKEGDLDHYCFRVKSTMEDTHPTLDINICPALIINEAKLSKEEQERLDHSVTKRGVTLANRQSTSLFINPTIISKGRR